MPSDPIQKAQKMGTQGIKKKPKISLFPSHENEKRVLM
jgi:hypothetical protein